MRSSFCATSAGKLEAELAAAVALAEKHQAQITGTTAERDALKAELASVEDRLSDLKSAIAGSDIDAVRSNTELLMNASQEFTQKLYQQAAEADAAGGSAGSAGAAGSTPNDDDVVDAEIVDEDESK